MTDAMKALDAILQGAAAGPQTFPPNSRYHGLATATITAPDGRPVRYLTRRFVPPAHRFALLREHAVTEGDRLDNLAAAHLGDPEQYWRLCDANGAMRPAELVEEIGRRLRITLPDGIPGTGGPPR
jgi:hypothetical protein